MKQVGEILKKEREKQDLSLHEIGLSLKINTKILKALEDGDQSHLPAKTFLRGFVKSYAQYLKMNPQEVLAAFDQEHKQSQQEKISLEKTTVPPQEKSITQMKPVEKTPFLKEFASSGRLTTVIVAAVLLFLIVFVVQTMNKYQNEKMLAQTTPTLSKETPFVSSTSTTPTPETSPSLPATATTLPTAKIESATPTTSINAAPSTKPAVETHPSTAVHGTTPSAASSTNALSSGQAVKVPTNAQAAATTPPAANMTTTAMTATKPNPVTTPSASSQTTPVATTKPVAVKPATTTAAATNSTATTTPPAATPPKPKSSTVLVEAFNKVVIKYALDGKTESITLNPGQVHTFKGSKPGLILEISDGGAVNLIVNGRDKGVPGEMGKPVKLTY